jgi:hypothetical protein
MAMPIHMAVDVEGSLALPYNMRECSVDALGLPGDPHASKSPSKSEPTLFMQWG